MYATKEVYPQPFADWVRVRARAMARVGFVVFSERDTPENRVASISAKMSEVPRFRLLMFQNRLSKQACLSGLARILNVGEPL